MWVGGELDDLDLLLGLDLGVEADAVGPLVLALVEAVPVVAGHAHHVALAQGDLVLGSTEGAIQWESLISSFEIGAN